MTTTKRECKNCGAALRANQIDPHDNLCDQCADMSEYYILTTLPSWVLAYIDTALKWLARLTGNEIVISRVSPGAGNEQAAI